jgi:uncharacterized alpha/beta hydrolase family protein
MHTECANTSESRKSIVKAKNSWMKLNCLGCTAGNTAVPQCCSNVAWDTNFPHVTKMINKTNGNPNQYTVKKGSDQHNSPPKTTQFQCSGKPT